MRYHEEDPVSKMTKDAFKRAVMAAFKEKGYTNIKLSMAIFGMQCGVIYHQEGCFGKQKAAVYLREKNGKPYLNAEQKNGIEWEWEIPEQ